MAEEPAKYQSKNGILPGVGDTDAVARGRRVVHLRRRRRVPGIVEKRMLISPAGAMSVTGVKVRPPD